MIYKAVRTYNVILDPIYPGVQVAHLDHSTVANLLLLD